MNKLTAKKLTVTAALLLVTALLASIFSGAAYSETRSGSNEGCSACALACTACVACSACSACTCLSCLGGELDLDSLTDYDFAYDYSTDDSSDSYDVGDIIDLG